MPDSPEESSIVDIDQWLRAQTWPDLKNLLLSEQLTAYEHPYGFVVCRIEGLTFPGWQIRIHLWPERQEYYERLVLAGLDAQQFHCHGWELRSKVAVGAIQERSCEVRKDPNSGYALYRVENDYGAGVSRLQLEELGIAASVHAEVVRTPSDDILVIRPGSFHASSAASSTLSVTVAATETTGNLGSYVVAPEETFKASNSRGPVAGLDRLVEEIDGVYQRQTPEQDQWASFVFVVNRSGKVLVLQTHRRPGIWQPAGGRAEVGDSDPLCTAVRETMEELGLELAVQDLEPLGEARRDVGEGSVYFWLWRMPDAVTLTPRSDEVVEMAWVTIDELASLSTYAATAAMADRLRGSI